MEVARRKFVAASTDPNELSTSYSKLPVRERAALHASVDALKNRREAKSCTAADHPTIGAFRK